MRFGRIASILVLMALLVVPVAAEEGTATLEVAPFFDGAYKAGQWLPVRVTVTNDGPDRNAIVRLGGRSGASFDTPIDLPSGARKSLVMYVRPDSFARTLQARVVDGEQELATAEAPLRSWTSATEVVGLLTARPLMLPQPESNSRQIKVVTHPLAAADLPPRAEGLSSFAIILLEGVSPETWTPEQTRALDDWMRGGGQLVIGLAGDQDPSTALPPPFQIAAAGPHAPQAVTGTVLASLGAEARIEASPLTPAEGAVVLDPLVVQQDRGRGRLTVLGFSLSDPALQGVTTPAAVWSSLLRLREFDPNFPPDMSPDEMQSQQLTQALFNLPVLALPPLKVLGGLLIAYMIVVGPVLYLVLRRIDRQAWAWGIIPLLTVLFSAGTYGYGLRVRGEDVILNQISIAQPAGERARVRTYAGIFSPNTREYDVEIDGDALPRPLQFDARAWGRETGSGSARGHFVQGSSSIRDLPVSQWAMTTFAAEGTVPFGGIETELVLGDNTIEGTVRNSGSIALRDVAIIQGNRAFPLGNFAPGEEKPVKVDVAMTGNPGGMPLSMMLFRGRWNQNSPPPPELRLPIQVVDSLYGYSPIPRPTDPLLIAWIDGSPIGLRVEAERIHHQQLTLVELPIRLGYGRSVTFPRGWLRAKYQTETAEEGTCMNQWGSGAVLINSNTVTATLRLPPAAGPLTVTKATLYAEVEGPPPDGATLEAYDWQNEAWVTQSERMGSVDLQEPGRFVRDGELRLKLTLTQGNMMKGGCFNLGASVGGTR